MNQVCIGPAAAISLHRRPQRVLSTQLSSLTKVLEYEKRTRNPICSILHTNSVDYPIWISIINQRSLPQIISLAVDNSWGESSVEESVAVFLSSRVVKTLRCALIYMNSPPEFDLTLRTLPQRKLEGSRCLEQQATCQLQRCSTLLPHPTSCRFCECRQVYFGYSKSSEVPQIVPRFLGWGSCGILRGLHSWMQNRLR